MKKADWIWMPHPAHFICASRCQFRLATYVGGYIVSTVGEMEIQLPEMAKILGKKVGDYDIIGWQRLYETMVFKAIERPGTPCCPYEIVVEDEVDMQGYNDANAATAGHMALCVKWSKEATDEQLD